MFLFVLNSINYSQYKEFSTYHTIAFFFVRRDRLRLPIGRTAKIVIRLKKLKNLKLKLVKSE